MLDSASSSDAVRRALSALDWRAYFDAGALQRGRAYAVRERATQLLVREKSGGWIIEGKVRGSRSTPYQTKVTVPFPEADEDFMADCSCPLGGDCKHGVAVVETFLARELTNRKVPSVARQAPEVIDSSLPVPLRHWIDVSLAEPVLTRLNGESADAAREVRYSFHLRKDEREERGGLGHISVLTFEPGSKGLGNARVANLRGAHRGDYPPCFSDTDVKLAQEMGALSNTLLEGTFSGALMQPRGRFWGLLVQDVLSTGRAIWDGNPKAVLKAGPERLVEACWAPDSSSRDGDLWTSCRFADNGQPAVILGTTQRIYIDRKNWTVGTALWKERVDPLRWLEAPKVPVSQVPRVCERMLAAGWEAELRPSKLAIRDLPVDQAQLTPRMVFTRIPVNAAATNYGIWGARREVRRVPSVVFQVRYGRSVIEYPFSERDPYITEVTPKEILRTERNFAREEGCKDFLERLGLRRMGQLFDTLVENESWREHAFTLPQEAVGEGAGDDPWYEFLGILPEIRAAGWEIEVRSDFGFELTHADDWWTELEDGGAQDWFRFDAGVQINGRRVSLLGALREITARFQPERDLPGLLGAAETAMVPVRLPEHDMVLAFPARRLGQLLSALLQLFEAPEANGAMVHKLGAARLAVLLPDLANDTANALRALGERLSDFQGVTRVKTPRTLKATLRAYQTDGLSWLQFLRSHGLNGILADDMGLGKTVQTLAHILVEKGAKRLDRPCLIVAPTSVVGNWAAEAAKFAPSLRVLVLQGPERLAAFDRIPKHDLVVTSYALLPRDGEAIQSHEYHYVILDEAQYIKNPASKMAQAACALRARHRLCLTGTPLENHLGELWSLFHFLMPGFLGEADAFRRHWRRPIESGENPHRREVLAKRVAPLLLRRTRNQVLQELHPRTDIVRSVPLNQAQAEVYEVVRAAMDKKVREAINAKGLAQSQIIVLDALLKLRQICCDPRLLKLPAARKVKESAKLESFRGLVTGLVEEGRRILVFSQFTSMIELLEKCLEKERISSLKLTGETPGNERAKLVNAFQAGEVPVFFISLKAGGSGLNLTTADTVIHYDPWWNPAVEEQATGRAHRMGQANPVFVYRLITEGTIEERILELQSRKAAIASAILEGGSGEPGRGLAIERSDLEMLLAPI
jgi:superfamily II DNA or RNA helicase